MADKAYYVNDRTGEVHESDCPRVKVIKSKTEWDPAKAALTPGVFADKICLHGQLPLRQAPRTPETLTEELTRLRKMEAKYIARERGENGA